MLGLHFCLGFSLVAVRRGHSLAVVLGFLTGWWFLLLWNTDPRASWSSVVAELLWAQKLQPLGSRALAQELWCTG